MDVNGPKRPSGTIQSKINNASLLSVCVHKSQVAGALMILLGAFVLILLAGFVVNIIVVILQLLAVIIGIFLVLGGIVLLIGRRWWRRGPWEWDQPPASA